MVDASGSRSPLPAAELVAGRIAAKRLFEARLLLGGLAREIDPALAERLSREVEEGIEEAQRLFARGLRHEQAGERDRAGFCYKRVEGVAVDHPDLEEARQRLELAGQLAELEQGSVPAEDIVPPPARPRMTSQPVPPRAAQTSPSPRSSGRRPLLPALVVLVGLAGLVGVGFLFRDRVIPLVVSSPPETNNQEQVRNISPPEEVEPVREAPRAAASAAALQTVEQPPATRRPKPIPAAVALPPREEIVPIVTAPPIPLPLPAENAPEKIFSAGESFPTTEMQGDKVPSNEARQSREETGAPVTPILDAWSRHRDAVQAVPAAEEPSPRDEVTGAEMHPGLVPSVVELESGENNSDSGQEPVPEEEAVGARDTPVGISVATSERAEEKTPQEKTPARRTWTVQPGDTLETIAKKMYGNRFKWSEIATANRKQLGSPPRSLQVGMTLTIPPLEEKRGRALLNPDGTYTVRSGDSLGSIARKLYGKSRLWQTLYRQNRDHLPTPGALRVGLVLRVDADLLMDEQAGTEGTGETDNR